MRYPDDELASWAARLRSDALWAAHFQLGPWIRKEWVHAEPALLMAQIRKLCYFVHADDLSSCVLEALWRVPNGEDCPTVEEMRT